MTLLPPRSTLFPYTTLFRSWMLSWMTRILPFLEQDAVWRQVDAEEDNPSIPIPQRYDPWYRQRFVGLGTEQDRKSTRLNSSHVEISYAVFCLKKKKAEQTDD